MKLGVYNAILHDRPLPEALKVIADLGLTGIEINTGPRDFRPIKQMRLVRFNGERYVLFSDVLESN